tara:strand:+ start:2676 stop:2855 length:180 start_codon:yes stop_codon:yes gene_type:complete
MKSSLVVFLEEFGNWWKVQDTPTIKNYVEYKIEKNELDDLSLNRDSLLKIDELLKNTHG